jgi:hypothetical protein
MQGLCRSKKDFLVSSEVYFISSSISLSGWFWLYTGVCSSNQVLNFRRQQLTILNAMFPCGSGTVMSLAQLRNSLIISKDIE